VPPEGVQFAHDLEEDVLGYVLRVGVVGQHPPRQVVHPRCILVKQRCFGHGCDLLLVMYPSRRIFCRGQGRQQGAAQAASSIWRSSRPCSLGRKGRRPAPWISSSCSALRPWAAGRPNSKRLPGKRGSQGALNRSGLLLAVWLSLYPANDRRPPQGP